MKKQELTDKLGTNECPIKIEVGIKEYYCTANVTDCPKFDETKTFNSKIDNIYWHGCDYKNCDNTLSLFPEAEQPTLFCKEHHEPTTQSSNGTYCPKCAK